MVGPRASVPLANARNDVNKVDDTLQSLLALAQICLSWRPLAASALTIPTSQSTRRQPRFEFDWKRGGDLVRGVGVENVHVTGLT